ncbi:MULTISPECIES: LysR family transcriptional regulator [Pseudomonas]|uniref:Transcriptional regulator, LysR family n=1 Tax=Pseudomonas fluorescens (strain Q2-87) TaxID=1038922 RepID=J2F0N0_PSEFQ|nr:MULTISPECIES: LysR family transcriptional regulator [Pseudomonas]EJL02498.1 transcriptional regulator, LysR family [Pseudomonas fluorescens Q2-87]
MLDLNDVALFVQVVRSGSFAEAARRLGMPSNTVSRRVQQLEAQLGKRLLQRSTRKLTLTQVGQGFFERCVDAVDGLAEAGQELMKGSDEPSGLVRIAAMADFFDFFPMQWVADFLAAHPRVQLDFVLSDAHVDLIADRIDVAFRGGALLDSGYVGRQLISNEGDGMVASPGYIARHGMPTSLQALTHHHSVSFAHPSGLSHWRLVGPDGAEHEVQVPTRFNANTAQALRKAAVTGLGIAVLPSAVISVDLDAGRLVRVLPQYQRSGFGLNVLYPSRRQLPLAVSAFIALVMDKLERKAFPARFE